MLQTGYFPLRPAMGAHYEFSVSTMCLSILLLYYWSILSDRGFAELLNICDIYLEICKALRRYVDPIMQKSYYEGIDVSQDIPMK